MLLDSRVVKHVPLVPPFPAVFSVIRGAAGMRGTPLTIAQILKWADNYFAREKQWPQAKSPGPADGPCGQETWSNLDAVLRIGRRGMPRGSSLARLLAE